MKTTVTDSAARKLRHTKIEDVYALLIGASLAAFGLVLLKSAQLTTSGIAGLALIGSHLTGISVGALFLLMNIPFVALSLQWSGRSFALRSVAASALLAGLAGAMPDWIAVTKLNPLFAAVFGGTLIGMGVLSVARHNANFGGFGVVALTLQEKRGISAGAVQMVIDLAIVLVTFALLGGNKALFSAVSVATMNGILAINHRLGRYVGDSSR